MFLHIEGLRHTVTTEIIGTVHRCAREYGFNLISDELIGIGPNICVLRLCHTALRQSPTGEGENSARYDMRLKQGTARNLVSDQQ